MKVIYLCTYYHVALLYSQLRHGLLAKGHDVSVMNTARFGTSIAPKFKEALEEPGVIHCECWREVDRLLFFPRQRKIETALLESYDPKGFDLMHAHLLVSSGFTARRMKRRFGLPYVASIRATDLNGFIRLPLFRWLAIHNAEEACGLLFLSATHRDEFMHKFVPAGKRQKLLQKSVVIGNPLERFWQEHAANPRGALSEDDKLRVLLVGRVNKVKNIPTASRAVEELRNRGIDATLTVVGEVEDEEELARIQAHSHVEMLPFMGPDELVAVYRSHDVFLLPSTVETFGRVYVEAMSQGLPVIYTKGQGFDGRYRDGEVGYAVAPDDPIEIADRIQAVLKDYPGISERCVRHAEEFYEDSVVDELESFYLRSLGAAKREVVL